MGNGISYALRLAPAKAAAEEGFPPAQDKKLLTAYRYQVSEGKEGGLLTVTVRPLGESFYGTIAEIAKESFWAQNKPDDVERQFPFAGAAGIFDDGKLVDNYRQMGHSVRPFADHL